MQVQLVRAVTVGSQRRDACATRTSAIEALVPARTATADAVLATGKGREGGCVIGMKDDVVTRPGGDHQIAFDDIPASAGLRGATVVLVGVRHVRALPTARARRRSTRGARSRSTTGDRVAPTWVDRGRQSVHPDEVAGQRRAASRTAEYSHLVVVAGQPAAAQ